MSSNRAVLHPRPLARSTSRLALQNPDISSRLGSTVARKRSIIESMPSGSICTQVTRQHEPSRASCSRCIIAISHSSTTGTPPMISAAFARTAATPAAEAVIASRDAQDAVAIERPDSRSTIIDSPTNPGISVSIGMTWSRT